MNLDASGDISKNSPLPTIPGERTNQSTDQLQIIWQVLRRHRLGVLGLGFLGLIMGFFTAYSTPPVYQGDSKLLAEPVNANSVKKNNYTGLSLVWLFYETQYEVIKSRAIAEVVVDELQLHKHPYFNSNYADTSTESDKADAEENLVGMFKSSVKEWLPKSWWNQEASLQKKKQSNDDQIRLNIIGSLQRSLVVKGGKKSKIIVISYESGDKQLAADVVNAVADAYINFGLDSRLNTAKKTSTWLSQQLTVLKQKLSDSEAALHEYRRKEGLVDTDSSQQIVSSKVASLTGELVKAQTRRSEAEIRYNQVRNNKLENGGYESLVPVLKNRLVSSLKEEHSRLARNVSELSERYGNKHPKMIAARSDLNEAERRLKREIKKVVDSIRKEYEVARKQERQIQRLIDTQKSEIRDLKGKEFELGKLERDVENNRQLYESFLVKFKETNVHEDYDGSNIRVIDRAEVPRWPIRPVKSRIVAVYVLFGLLLGVLVAFLRERLNNTFNLAEEIEERLSLPLLGIVPYIRPKDSANPERERKENSGSPFAESINHIRTGILFSNVDTPPQVLLLTSSTAGEGKTTLSNNLGLAFGQLGRTLLVEADLRKSRLTRISGYGSELGLSDLVSGQHLARECIRKDKDNANLYMLPAGHKLPNPLEFLSSDSFRRLLLSLRKSFDYIIIDAPPVLAVSDAIVLGHQVDGVLMVVKAEDTTHQMAQDALRRLNAANIEPIGAVLSQADVKRMSYYGSHYYHYDASYYGYSTDEDEAK